MYVNYFTDRQIGRLKDKFGNIKLKYIMWISVDIF